ncbi:MAG TPA: hypothetical protein DEP84_24305 [Chloroflexi bacterium]|nr:hypothetical protein [Chloroflexota bacterium]
MNDFARVVYRSVTGEKASPDIASPDLSPEEQAALVAMAPALRLAPQALAALLARGEEPQEWPVAPHPAPNKLV